MNALIKRKFISLLLCVCLVFTPMCFERSKVHALSPDLAVYLGLGSTIGPAASVAAAILIGSGIGALIGPHLGSFIDTVVSFYNQLTAPQKLELDTAGEAALTAASASADTFSYTPSADMVSAVRDWVSSNADSITSISPLKPGYISPSTDTWTIPSARISGSDSMVLSAPLKLGDDLSFLLAIRNISYMMAAFASYSIDNEQSFTSYGLYNGYGAAYYANGNLLPVSITDSSRASWQSFLRECTLSLIPAGTAHPGAFKFKVTSDNGAYVTFADYIYLDASTASYTPGQAGVSSQGTLRSTVKNADLVSDANLSMTMDPLYLPTGTFTGTGLSQSYDDYIEASADGIAMPLAPDYPLDIPLPGQYDYADSDEYLDDLIHIGTGIRDYTYSPDSPDTPIARPDTTVGDISTDWPVDVPLDNVDTSAGGEGASEDLPWIFNIPILGQILKALKALWDALVEGFNKIINLIKSLIGTITGGLDSLFNKFKNFWNGIPDTIRNILNVLQQILENLVGFVLDLGSFLTGILAFISGYSIFQNLLIQFLPYPIAVVMWAMWICAVAIWLLRMLLDR